MPVELPGEAQRYEVAKKNGSRYHSKCNACHKVFDVPTPDISLAPLAQHGFRIDEQRLTLYGLYTECIAAR